MLEVCITRLPLNNQATKLQVKSLGEKAMIIKRMHKSHGYIGRTGLLKLSESGTTYGNILE